jgi:predicted nucleic acid-binding protein
VGPIGLGFSGRKYRWCLRTAVFDAGAFIALERRDTRALALVAELVEGRRTGYVPAGVLAQIWRGSPRQHAVTRMLRTGALHTESMSQEVALRTGLVLARTGTSDVVDAHLVLLGRKLNAVVVTSDMDDLRRLDPGLDLVAV